LSCGDFAKHAFKGIGLEKKDPKAALEALNKGCSRNDANSCLTLGVKYLKGITDIVEKDPKKAFPYLEKSCGLGHANACQIVKVMYKRGDGVEKSEEDFKKYKQRTKELITDAARRLGASDVQF
jgi:TPR repeat protein